MTAPVFIARLLGPLFIAIGAGILLNPTVYAAIVAEATHSPTMVYFSGLMSLLPGLAILNVYRAWTADWRIVVTILGWLLVIGGVVRIVLPQTTETLAISIYSTSASLTIAAVIVLVLGAFLSFVSYRQ